MADFDIRINLKVNSNTANRKLRDFRATLNLLGKETRGVRDLGNALRGIGRIRTPSFGGGQPFIGPITPGIGGLGVGGRRPRPDEAGFIGPRAPSFKRVKPGDAGFIGPTAPSAAERRASERGFDTTGLASGLHAGSTLIGSAARVGRRAFGSILQEGITFERSMSEVLAFGGDKFLPFMDALTAKARELGSTKEFTANQVAGSTRQLTQAGLAPVQILKRLPTVLNLAKAGAIDLTSSARILTSTMAQFGVKSEKAENTADLLAATSTATQTNVQKLGESLAKVGSNADLMGLSLKQTLVLLGVMGKTSVNSGTAGRQLTGTLNGLAKLTLPRYAKSLKSVGIDQKTLRENLASGNVLGAVKQFDAAFDARNLDGPAKFAAAIKIFGRIGGRGFGALLKGLKESEQGTTRFTELEDALRNVDGAAAKMGQRMTENTQGSVKKFDSALSELKLTISTELLPALKPLIQMATTGIKEFAAWGKENKGMVTTLGIAGGALVVFGLVMAPVLSGLASLATLAGAAAGIGGIGALAGAAAPPIAAFVALSLAMGLVLTQFKKFEAIEEKGDKLRSRRADNVFLGDLSPEQRAKLRTASAERDRLHKLRDDTRQIIPGLVGSGKREQLIKDIAAQQKIVEDITKAGKRAPVEAAAPPVKGAADNPAVIEKLLQVITEGNFGSKTLGLTEEARRLLQVTNDDLGAEAI